MTPVPPIAETAPMQILASSVITVLDLIILASVRVEKAVIYIKINVSNAGKALNTTQY